MGKTQKLDDLVENKDFTEREKLEKILSIALENPNTNVDKSARALASVALKYNLFKSDEEFKEFLKDPHGYIRRQWKINPEFNGYYQSVLTELNYYQRHFIEHIAAQPTYRQPTPTTQASPAQMTSSSPQSNRTEQSSGAPQEQGGGQQPAGRQAQTGGYPQQPSQPMHSPKHNHLFGLTRNIESEQITQPIVSQLITNYIEMQYQSDKFYESSKQGQLMGLLKENLDAGKVTPTDALTKMIEIAQLKEEEITKNQDGTLSWEKQTEGHNAHDTGIALGVLNACEPAKQFVRESILHDHNKTGRLDTNEIHAAASEIADLHLNRVLGSPRGYQPPSLAVSAS